MKQRIKILLADDHTLFRKGLINLIHRNEEMLVTAEASCGREVLNEIESGSLFDLIILDVSMPEINGIETMIKLFRKGSKIPILMVAMDANESLIIHLIRLGAKGFVLKSASPEELTQAIRTVAKNLFFFNEVVYPTLLKNTLQKPFESKQWIYQLSEREISFLKLISTELTYKEIANIMSVSNRTIDGYRDALFDKLQVNSRIGLALFSLRQGFSQLS